MLTKPSTKLSITTLIKLLNISDNLSDEMANPDQVKFTKKDILKFIGTKLSENHNISNFGFIKSYGAALYLVMVINNRISLVSLWFPQMNRAKNFKTYLQNFLELSVRYREVIDFDIVQDIVH